MNRMEEVFSVMKKAGPKENVTCQSCQKTASDSFCHSCHQYICAECVKAHKQLQFFRSHEIVSIDSLRSSFSNCSPEKTKLAPCEVKCSKHTDEPLKLYCHDCHKLVCRDCILIDHKDHRYAFVVDAAPLCKAELGERVGEVREVSEGLKEAVKSLDESKKKLSDHNTSTMRAIDDVIGKISAKLMEKKSELKKAASVIVEEAERKIGTQEKGVQLAVGEVESLLEFMSHSLERATDQEVLSLEKQMSDQADRVSRLYGNPAGKFAVPQLPELVVHCGAEVEQAIKTGVSVFDGPPPQSVDSAAALPLSAGGDTPEVTPATAVQFSQNRTLTLKRGDIVREKADILVNAANCNLVHGGGLAGALNAASEGELQAHSDTYMNIKRRGREIPAGGVVVTPGGGKLECKFVIHAVGPSGSVHVPAQCERLLKQVIRNTLIAAGKHNATAIVIPAISCGIFGVSKELVAQCIIDTILSFNYTKPAPVLSDIRIVIVDRATHSCFAHYIKQKALPHKNESQGNRSSLWRDIWPGRNRCSTDIAAPSVLLSLFL